MSLAIFTISLSAQVTLRVDEVDDFSGDVKKVSKPTSKAFTSEEGYIKADISAVRVGDYTAITLSLNTDVGCLSEHSTKILIKLTDGEIIECKQLSDTDCSDRPSARFIFVSDDQMKMDESNLQEILGENLQKLLSTPVEKIRIYATDGYIDMKPHKIGGLEIMEHLKAVQ